MLVRLAPLLLTAFAYLSPVDSIHVLRHRHEQAAIKPVRQTGDSFWAPYAKYDPDNANWLVPLKKLSAAQPGEAAPGSLIEQDQTSDSENQHTVSVEYRHQWKRLPERPREWWGNYGYFANLWAPPAAIIQPAVNTGPVHDLGYWVAMGHIWANHIVGPVADRFNINAFTGTGAWDLTALTNFGTMLNAEVPNLIINRATDCFLTPVSQLDPVRRHRCHIQHTGVDGNNYNIAIVLRNDPNWGWTVHTCFPLP